MKKKLLSVLMLLACVCMVNAQKLYVGGSIGLTYSNLKLDAENNQSGVSFKLLPEVGYQFNKHHAVGINIGYMNGYAALGSFDPSDLKALGNAVISSALDVASDDLIQFDPNVFRFAPYYRYTFFSNQKIELFLDAILGLNFIRLDAGSTTIDGNTVEVEDEKLRSFEICARPGIAFNVNKHLQLSAKVGSFGFQHLNRVDSEMALNRFGLDVEGTSLLFGITYSFDLKK